MKIYTKIGDGGSTSLATGVRVLKSDDRIELLGTIDELSSHMGLAKVVAPAEMKEQLSKLQQELIGIMAGVANPRERKYKVTTEQIDWMEAEIDRMEDAFPRVKKFILYGGCELSARLDVARAVARRAERCFKRSANRYGADAAAMKYMNRLSDFLYVSARYADYLEEQKALGLIKPENVHEQHVGMSHDIGQTSISKRADAQLDADVESIVRAVLKKLREVK